MSRKGNFKSILSIILTICMMASLVPNVFAAQSNEYTDPAEVWLSSNNRTNELDVNATTTYETQYCCVCDKTTTVLTYRVPEYTRSGETALNRDVQYSDGTKIDGEGRGNLDDGTPGVDAYYTGYHWTKAVCQTCGTINPGSGYLHYGFNNNVYGLYPCDNNFYLQFDNTTYENYDEDYHLTTLKRGEYCKFCKGTYARATRGLEEHNFTEQVDGQIGNNRFYIAEKCDDCGYETSEYVTAKSVITSYYGIEDGDAHTLTVNDLSDRGVKTSIRYGTSADSCTKTSAPNYTQAGYYTVYYEIDYSYAGEVMTENGVSYIHLVADDEEENNSNGTIIVLPPQTHEHEFHYLETVKPSCEELGYERFQCNGCGELDKRNYTPALGHDYDDIVIREATCKQGGLVLTLCADCGDFYQTTTQAGEHKYKSVNHNATCRNVGYTEHTCEVCGDNYINNIQPLISHSYERVTKEPTCTDKGYTTSTCTMCGLNTVSDYTEPLGHDWDEGHTVTSSTCDAEGVIEYHCLNECGEKMIMATDANGHTPGAEATCTEPQICEVCETVLVLPLGHDYDSDVTDATCTAMGYTTYTCVICDDSYVSDYTDKIDHDYNEVVTEPTCTEHGYTTYTCVDCDDSYVSDYVDAIPHNHKGIVTEPTCTSMGFTTYTCEDCGDSYVGDYVDMTEHNYNKETVEPTCTEHGYAVYTCPDCGKSYISDYKESIEHTYTETVIAPTCTEMGYTIFKCNDCDDEYKGNYTDKIPHDYEKTVTEPTCTEFGHTTYSCKNCDAEYVADYTDKLAHEYEAVVTDATCLTMGYTTYTCECGETYKADYKEPLGHTPSEWIVDVPATIEAAGSKHIECTVCGETLQSADLPQLIDKDNSDEDGKAEVGDYSIILTDENGKPIFNSELTIDVNDNVSIKLTNGRLLDFAKPTTITAFYTESQQPKENLKIYIEDVNGNKAIGFTNADGQLIVPNNKTNTNDDNGTIGKEDGETKETFVITVTDKANVIIPNCEIYIGESNNVVVDLPEGIKPTREEPVIVTITDHNGKAQADVTVIALGDADFIEKGKTDIYGKITLPTSADGYTDEEGHVNVNELNVLVNDELGAIADAYVKYNDDNTITVTLPEEKTITYANRITVTVTDSIGGAVKDKSVTVLDVTEKSYTALTDENGKVVVPPVNTDMTDAEGKGVVSGYDVVIYDETKPIENAYIEMVDGKLNVVLPEGVVFDYHNRITAEIKDADGNPAKEVFVNFTDGNKNVETVVSDENGKAIVPPVHKDMTDVNGEATVNGYKVVLADEKAPIANAYIEIVDSKINVKLPEGVVFDYTNRITATVTDKEDKPVKDMSVTFTDSEDKSESNLTDENGKASVPPVYMDYTDVNGYSEVDGYIVTVVNEKGAIEKALVTHNAEVKNEDETVKTAENITVLLPAGNVFDYENRITVTVQNKTDKTSVKDLNVIITEAPIKAEDATEEPVAKTLTEKTDANGKAVFPPLNEDITDNEGNSGVEETKPGEGENADDVKTAYKVLVADTKGIIGNALVEIKDGKVTVTLPETHTLTTSNQTTVTVTDNEDKAVKGVSVTIKDKTTFKSGTTDANGKVTLPVKSSGGGGGGGSYSGGGGGGGSYVSTTVKITDKDGKTVSVTRSVTSTKATLTLPTGKNLLEDDNYYTITVTSGSKAKADYPIVLKDKKGNEVTGTTDENGIIVLPGKEHKAYIFGYNDGTFRADNDMTRSEAAAIFARLIAEEKGETVSGKATFSDVKSNDWCYK
ncbi:MAG: Ig-like domain-containing protein, partial [Clostridia bacterium]|nr:Ig-like domain-containing protein [Clostridia bacterium]